MVSLPPNERNKLLSEYHANMRTTNDGGKDHAAGDEAVEAAQTEVAAMQRLIRTRVIGNRARAGGRSAVDCGPLNPSGMYCRPHE
jgi:hypothetical protein